MIWDCIHPGGGGRSGSHGTMQEKSMVIDYNNDRNAAFIFGIFAIFVWDFITMLYM
jgi:hypothetical protein